jgi:hypothetical protein
MILDKEVEIVVNSKKINHYKNFGYELKPGQKINVKIEHLSLGSKVLINVKCDVCGKEKKLTYNEYVDNTKKFTELYCCSRKCGEVKKEKTNLKIYGVKNVSQSEVVKQKKTETCLKNWGVEYPSQNIGIFEKQQKNSRKLKFHEKTGLYYRGSYEAHFLDYCFENNIKVEKAKSIKYEFEDKKRTYHPDFFLKEKNLIIEIKSTYTYNKYLQKNLAKQKACIKQGFKFMFIIDKDYKKFKKKSATFDSRFLFY